MHNIMSACKINIEKLLLALNCPFSKEINLDDTKHYITLIRWLEDRIIREYEIDERLDLHLKDNNVDNLFQWGNHFNCYLKRLMCPFEWEKDHNIDCLYWLLSFAISISYEENFAMDDDDDGYPNNDSNIAFNIHGNNITNFDKSLSGESDDDNDIAIDDRSSEYYYETENVSNKLIEIGELIKISRYEEENITSFLHRIFKRIKFSPASVISNTNTTNTSTTTIDNINTATNTANTTNTTLTEQSSQLHTKVDKDEAVGHNMLLSMFPLGFDCKDKLIHQVALVLKMLYLSDFRELQTEINSLLVLVQESTANPKLNSALGKVGF